MNIAPVKSQNPSFNAFANLGPAVKHTGKGKEIIKELMLNADHIVSAESIAGKEMGHFGVRIKTILNDIYDLSYPIKSRFSNGKELGFEDFIQKLNNLPEHIKRFTRNSEPILK